MFWMFYMLGCAAEIIPADGIWEVTIEEADEQDEDNQCGDGGAGYRKVYRYEMFQAGSSVELKIDGEVFATGEQVNYDLTYRSAIYLEDKDPLVEDDSFRWKIEGEALVQGAAGGSPDLVDEGLDWLGTETLTVVDSENEDVMAPGCTVQLKVGGVYLGRGDEQDE